MHAPQIIVGQLLLVRRLERLHLDSQRAQAAHDLADGPVLARCIHALEHHEQGVLVLGVEKILELVEFIEKRFDLFVGFVGRLVVAGVAGIIVLEVDLGAGLEEHKVASTPLCV